MRPGLRYPLAGAILSVFGLVAVARAEPVLVRPQNGQNGHGWLFGSTGRIPGECWIAVPAHVVKSVGVVGHGRFTFTDRRGRNGESGSPIPVQQVPRALEVAGGETDLAFAKVEVGPARGECMSRLGLPALAYDPIIATSPTLSVTSLLATSFGVFDATISRGGIGDGRAGRLDLRAVSAADGESFLKGGLSGATAVAIRDGNPVPFAMVLAIGPERRIQTLRFDRIRSAFEQVDAHLANPAPSRQGRELPYRILDYTGTSAVAGDGPSVVTRAGGCWMVRPPDRGGSSSLTIDVPTDTPRVRSITVDHPFSCGAAPRTIGVEQRLPGETDWVFAKECVVGDGAEVTTCRVDYATPRQFRLSFRGIGPSGIARVRLQ
jgi:hypothetical protein